MLTRMAAKFERWDEEPERHMSTVNSSIGAECNCERCGVRCRVGATKPSTAKMLRRAAKPKGVCNNCAVSEWLANTYPVNMIIEESQHGPAVLLFQPIQEQFTAIMKGNSDMEPGEINWQTIVNNWSLPLTVKLSNSNCHLPGDSVTRKLAKKQVREESLFSQLTKMVEDQQGRPTLHTALSFMPEDEEDGGYIC